MKVLQTYLKPCPFCGEGEELWLGDTINNDSQWPAKYGQKNFVFCGRCDAAFGFFEGTYDEAKEWWNERIEEK